MSCRQIAGVLSTGFTNPKVVTLTSGTSYTSSAGVDYLEVYAIGGGGGGGGATSSNAGCGGGAGNVSFKFFPPGTYTYAIGTGGAAGSGGGTGVAGSNGTQTSFNTLIGLAGSGGSGASSTLPQRGGLAGGISGTAQCSFSRQPGHTSNSESLVESSGNGGSNLFGDGGPGYFTTAAGSTGFDGTGFGGGGGGGVESGAGGAGSPGGIIIIEYY